MADMLHSYILPGRAADPRVGITQAQEGEQLGLAGVFLSERWESKELGAVMGALSQATKRLKLVAGLTHFGTRHPLVQAGMGATMQMLSGGRFVLGFGRAVPPLFRKLGITVLNNAGMADHVAILRRLWTGDTVSYSGPAGHYPEMQLAQPCDNPPPVILGAVGPKTLALAGAHFDGTGPASVPNGGGRGAFDRNRTRGVARGRTRPGGDRGLRDGGDGAGHAIGGRARNDP